ncbi:MAG TPA: efflux RND transporter permease subunit [Candidatus Lustribacter sp.]|nr:efflux RND transporter permease subunit [Candidatus Lustribacter sp.]
MWLTRVFLKRPTLVFVFIALTLIAAVMALQSLVVQEQPNSGLPGITISVGFAGASTTELQTEVAEPIEDQLAGTPYLVSQSTTIESGSVSISATFSLQSTNPENIANVEKAIQSAQRQLPAGITSPTLRVANPSEPVIVTLALLSKKYDQAALGTVANNTVVPAIEQLPGVSNVNIAGTTQPTFTVTVDPNLLAADNLTLSDVVGAITPNNVRAPGGYVYGPSRETELDVRGDLATPQDVADLPIHVTYGGTTSDATSTGGTGAFNAGLGGPVGSANVPIIVVGATPMPQVASGGAQPRPLPSSENFGTSGGNSAGSNTVAASVPVDQPMNVSPAGSAAGTSNSTSSSTTAQAGGGAQPSGGASSFGSGSGTAMSPFVGGLQNWAVPSADKRISDVASVQQSTEVPRVSSSQNGQPGVTLNIQKQADASEVTVSNEVLAALPALKRQFPDIQFEIAHVQSTFTEEQVEGVEHTLLEGIVLTAIVMLFFLGSWRNAVVVMVAIPTSLGVTLFLMNALGLTLDTVSLMAMTLVIGILIDDSTVVLENIERHAAAGESPADAAINGRTEIGQAAIVITLVDVVVFLPLAFVGGQIGRQLDEFAIVIVVASLTSLLVSFTITPTLAGLWSLKSTWKPWKPVRWFDARFNEVRTRYHEQWLPGAMNRPWPILVGAAVACALAYVLVPTGLVGEEYIPAEDQGIIYAQVAFPAGHPLTQTIASMDKLEAATKQVVTPHDLQYETTVAGAYSAAFGGFAQEGNVGQISIFLNTDRRRSTYAYVADLLKRYSQVEPSASISVAAATQQGGGNQQQIDELVSVAGNADPTPYAARVFTALEKTPGATGVQNSQTNAAPQMEIDFNRAALQSLDVSIGTAAAAVEAGFGGDTASQIETPDRGLTNIEVIYPRSDQTTLAGVLNIPLRSEAGGIVRLGDVAYLRSVPAPLIITRQNRAQVVHITGNVAPGYELSNVVASFQKQVNGLHLPRTVTIRPAAQGQQDLMGQALGALLTSLGISIVLVFLLIVALYNSYRTPFVTLFAIPVAVIGALGALWITHNTLNLYSLLGMILLVGLVTKNGILLVDYADTVRVREGRSREDGMREAASTRFRPIIMTTIAMVAGMTPLALGLEPGTATRTSLAIVVIGGLLSSLVLTLFIVPIMYRWIAPKELREETHLSSDKPRPPQGGSQPSPA